MSLRMDLIAERTMDVIVRLPMALYVVMKLKMVVAHPCLVGKCLGAFVDAQVKGHVLWIFEDLQHPAFGGTSPLRAPVVEPVVGIFASQEG
jgi:hypothetical protein